MVEDDPCILALMQHLEVDRDLAERWTDYLAKMTFGHDAPLFDLKHDLEALENIERALLTLQTALNDERRTQPAHGTLAINLLFGPYAHLVGGGRKQEDLPKEMTSYQENEGQASLSWLNALDEHLPRLRAAIQSSKKTIRQAPNAKIGLARINLEGIKLVDAARSVWMFAKDKEAPSQSINMATPFGRYLSDLFDALEVEGDPRAAFNAWKRDYHDLQGA